MTHYPPSLLHQKRRKALRIVGMTLSGLMVLMVVVIFLFILRSERAHDEASCPFAKLSERDLAGAHIVEEARSCLPEVEERRYLVSRPGKPSYELARKRLSKESFSPKRYQWALSEDKQQRLVLRIEVDGQLSSEFREEDVPGH